MSRQERKAALERELIDLLARHDFHRRYYELYEAAKHRGEMSGVGRKVLEQELAATGYEFSYNKQEDSFDSAATVNATVVSVHAGVAGSKAELSLNVRERDAVAGGPFSVLALKAARLKDPAYRHDPPYPTLPFSNRQELQDILKYGLQVFETVKNEFRGRKV